MGLVRFGELRKIKLGKTMVIGIITLLITITLVLLTAFGESSNFFASIPGWVVPAGVGIFIITIFSLLAYTLDLPRVFVYGLIFGLSFPAAYFLKSISAYFLILGALLTGLTMLIVGSTLLARFIRDHPIPMDEPQT
jgi:hypothetical protein